MENLFQHPSIKAALTPAFESQVSKATLDVRTPTWTRGARAVLDVTFKDGNSGAFEVKDDDLTATMNMAKLTGRDPARSASPTEVAAWFAEGKLSRI